MRTQRTVELAIGDGTRLVVHEELELSVARTAGIWRVLASLEPSRVVVVEGGAARAFTPDGQPLAAPEEVPEEAPEDR